MGTSASLWGNVVIALIVGMLWLGSGFLSALVMHRRGHDLFSWGLLFLVLGPLALPVAFSEHRHRPPDPEAPNRDGRLDILLADDGSPKAQAAFDAALATLGEITSVTVATVVDLEAATTVRGHVEERAARARLDAAAARAATATGAPVDTVLLYGNPAEALTRFAVDHGYELIVAGSMGHGPARALHGSVTRQLAACSPVPVLLGPATR